MMTERPEPGASGPSEATSFEITSSPLAAFMGAALITGVARDATGDLRVYVGARYNGVYVLIPPGEKADSIERAWNGYLHGHLFMRPAPSGDMLFCDKEPGSASEDTAPSQEPHRQHGG